MTSPIPSMEFASSTTELPRKYDVLINFNGEDIGRKFVSHLDSILSAVGLTTFLHHDNGVKSMNEPILNLYRVAIVVFTKTYSQSPWCLHQLQQIIQWHQTYSRHVLPVYYEIQPFDVRSQKGDFGKAFKKAAHQTFSQQQLEHGMSKWTHALTKAANFFGWNESNYRSDAELVDKIVKSVLNLPVLSATKFPVGLQSKVEDLIQTIKDKSSEVCIIGISGAGGSGKTTLAKAIYNKIHETFTEKSFIEDIGQVSRTRGHHRLQEQFLLDVLKTRVEIPSVDMGRRMIRERLTGKRVLIVLDDVTENFTLLDLWGCREWFGGGTVIIITTRDVDLPRILKVDSVFGIRLMNANESLELLSWHAFREVKPKEEYNYLAKGVVTHCGGLPLALEVIGNCLFKKTKEEWNSILLKLEKIPLHNVQGKLKISFDGLRNQIEKDLFLDICCSFVGEGRDYVTKMLNGCGVDADSGIRVLIELSLIKVKRNNKLGMHLLLQEMGRNIINEIYEKEFRRERRLRFDDSEYVLTDNTGRRAIERVPVKLRSVRREPSRLLTYIENSDYISKKLRWISLDWFSLEYLPDKFYLHDAITIDLKHSSLRFLLKEPQDLRWLKVLNLSHSKYLTETPDFSGLPSLEQLILKDCTGLREVHPSIGCLCNLTLLNLKDCTSLSNLPREIYKLISLETLILSGCSMIDLLEKDVVQMESLVTLIAENTIVNHVPFSILSSKSIGHISLRGFERLSRNIFPSIIRSWMSTVMNPISYIHSLCMDIDNSWENIGPLLSSLENLRSVLVQCDTEYQLSKQVKSILVEYFANFAESGISKQFRSSFIRLGTYHEFFNAVSDNISEVLLNSESCDVSLPVDNLPNWLAYMGEGNSVSFSVPWDRDMKGMALSVVYLSTGEIVATECLRSVLIVNYTKSTLQIHKYGTIISFNDIDWQGIMSNLAPEDKVEIFVTFGHGLVVKNTILYLVCGEPNYLKKELESKKNSLLRSIMKIVM
ncbi:disease resistance protein RUN1 isoform X1 [Vigna angularis]|nr:disease resistance protein RUN1 isoform X1 [Vigna angularis]